MSYYQQPGGGAPPPVPPHPNQHPQGYGAPSPGQGQWGQPPPPQNQQYGQQGYGQQGYGAPPPGQGQWGQPPPPQNQQWGAPPPQQYGQQGYGQPPPGQGQWGQPPPQQGYGAPPPGQYGAPPPNQYGAPPPNQYGAPPPGQYGAPPPGQYGAPPQGQYGAPPPGQYGAPQGGQFPPTPASPGYDTQRLLAERTDMRPQAEALRRAMKGMGTDEKALVKTLAKLTPAQANSVREDFNRTYQRDLSADIRSETSGYFRDALIAVVRGPLFNDVHALHDAMKGIGTKEVVLNDVLMGRSNADIKAIKQLYQTTFGRSLEADLRGDLSAATEDLFVMIVAANRNEDAAPVIPQQVQQDVTALQGAFGNVLTKNPKQACQILTSKNDAQLRAIAQEYQSRFQKPLLRELASVFTGHMEDALVLLLSRAQNRAASDAKQLEDAMKGMGTKDELLVQRVVRAHWNRDHMAQVRSEFQKAYRKDLVSRIKGETRGDYERMLVALAE